MDLSCDIDGAQTLSKIHISEKVRGVIVKKTLYYALCSKHLDLRELEMTLNRNETKYDFCYLHIHHMGMVGVDDITKDNLRAHFSSISDIIPGEILDVNRFGLRLEVLEISPNSGKYLYQRAGSYNYWIHFHNKYVHFFSGHVSKYTCIVTDKPMGIEESVDYYRKTRVA